MFPIVCCVCVQVEQFWRFYSHLVRPGDLSGHSDFHLFKEGIKPMWEVKSKHRLSTAVCLTHTCCASHLSVAPLLLLSGGQDESNRSGGKWIIRLRKGLASRFWENIILAMLGEQFMVGEEICGAVVSIRFQVRPGAQAAVCLPPFTDGATRRGSNSVKIFSEFDKYSSVVHIVFGKIFANQHKLL